MSEYEQFYRSLYRIRRVEEEIIRVYPSDDIKSPVHLSIGQEAIAVGVCEALEPADVVFGTYRGHAMYLAKGGDLKKMLAELYGKVTGVARGKGGSMHLISPESGVMGTSAVVGTTIPQAVGYAYALKVKKSKSVVVSFFGDGAVEEGVFQESLNFASLKNLPIIFVCENNLYAIHSHQRDRQANSMICERVETFGIPATQMIDGDVIALHKLVRASVDNIRERGAGPSFIECMCYRWMEHVGPGEDFSSGYRSIDEAEPWYENDQVNLIGNRLTQVARDKIQAEVEAEIKEALIFAEKSPFPDDSDLYSDLFEGE